jgi:hypothetical protein
MKKLVFVVIFLTGCAGQVTLENSTFKPGRFTSQGFVCEGECAEAFDAAIAEYRDPTG